MLRIKKTDSDLVFQIVVLQTIILIVVVVLYTYRLSAIGTAYSILRINKEINQVERDLYKCLEGVDQALKETAVEILKNHQNVDKAISNLSNRSSNLPIIKVSWMGGEDQYMNLSGVNQELNRNTNENLIRRGIAEPWVLILGGHTNNSSSEGISAVYSVYSDNGRYIGSFLMRIDDTAIRKNLDEAMYISNHPELSYALFTQEGEIIVSSSSNPATETPYLESIIEADTGGNSNLASPHRNIISESIHHYQIKEISIFGYDYKIVMTTNQIVALKKVFHRFSFAVMDLVILIATIMAIFYLFYRKYLNPICQLAKAARLIELGHNDVYVDNYKIKELNDISRSLRSLTQKKHALTDCGHKMKFALKQLEGLKQERVEFNRNIQHVIRTPIGHIIGSSELLSAQISKKRSSEVDEYLEVITNASKELLESANNLIENLNMSSGSIKLNEVDSSIKKIIEEVIDSLLLKIAQARISYELHVDSNLPQAYIDPVLVRTAIFNLVDNSIKFSNDGSKIIISAKRNASGIIISIEDKGQGISEEQLRYIIELFENYSAHNTDTAKHGIGLGLTIAHHIFDLHNAVMTIKSKRGAGTKISIIIPNIRIR